MRNPSRPRTRQARPRGTRAFLSVERCEPRLLLTTYVVNTTVDDPQNTNPDPNANPLTLRDAINLANRDSTSDLIQFQIPSATLGMTQVIKPAAALPAIMNTVTVDGESQPGYVNKPVVVLDGSGIVNSPSLADGLRIRAGGTVVQGLGIENFPGSAGGISILGVSNCLIQGNFIGVDPVGLAVAGNANDGVNLNAAPGNTIGGTAAGAGNVIGGNGGSGINVLLQRTATNELIEGNFIGISPANGGIGLGSISLSNRLAGVSLMNASGVTVGGTAAGAGNVISFNGGYGVEMSGSGNLLQGNEIGTDQFGLTARANGFGGVHVGNSSDNTIGGPEAGAGNIISGNTGNGILVNQAGATGNLIEANLIGVGLRRAGLPGNSQIGNTGNGIQLQDAPGNSIVANIISSNNFAGIFLNTSNTLVTTLPPGSMVNSNNSIRGNIIGLDSVGNKMSNLTDGIDDVASSDTTIGGTTAADRNVISGNGGNGISFRGPTATRNLVQGNYIGTDASGNIGNLVGNVIDGIFFKNSPGNTIGGTAAGAGNVIAQNRIGLDLESFDNASLANNERPFLMNGTTDDNLIQGNKIGTDVTGTQPVGNYGEGVLIVDGSRNQIGGASPGAGNLISANLVDGVSIISQEPALDLTTGNAVQGNVIGLNVTGTDVLPNGQAGVRLIGAINTTVGGSTAGAGNVLSGNVIGLDIAASTNSPPGTPLNAFVLGNIIGLGSDGLRIDPATTGSSRLNNTGDGVILELGAQGVTIGGTAPSASNVIAGNGASGVRFASGATGNAVVGNRIGLGIDGQTVRSNNQSGVFIAEGSNLNTIGGTSPGSGNVISGNSTGVTLTNTGTVNNLIEGNIVGLTADGSTSAGNVAYGFLLLPGAMGNTIGGTVPGSRNVISSNGQGITIDGPGLSGNLIQGNYIGVDASGSMARANDRAGIAVNDSGSNTIGGTSAGAGNVISGNTGPGLVISGSNSSSNLIAGNLVGLDATGTFALGNVNFGIQVDNAPRNTIGGDIFTARNVISGNIQAGIEVNGVVSFGSIISGNLIGTDITGREGVGNLADGILINNTPGVVIGGATGLDGNIVSGNMGNGITIVGAGSVFDLVAGNLIGTDGTGNQRLGNVLSGVFVNGAPGVTIGGTISTLRNVISGNLENGVRAASFGSFGTVIQGNLIGANATGRGMLSNFLDGVLLDGSASVTVGGTVPGSTNILSGNGSAGVEVGAGSQGNVVVGNLIGTDSQGQFALPNVNGVFVNGARFSQIGGSSPFSGNLISGNSGAGVEVFGVGSIGNAIQGNRIGTDLFGVSAVANLAGVFIDSAPSNLVGGSVLGMGNLISGNVNGGVIVQGTDSSGNLIQGNLVGTDATGSRAIGSSSPQQSGILLTDAPRNVVGGSVPTAANVLSGNVVGVVIAGFNAQGNLVIGNLVGTDISGRSAVANVVGVYVNGSSSNTIGGSTPGFGNLISGNTSTGVSLFGPQTTKTVIAGNRIGTNRDGSSKLPNAQGIFIQSSPSNTIGGPTKSAGNLISGNSVTGVYLFSGASGNLIQDNVIGFTASGGPLGNAQYGILFYNAANNVNDKSPQTGNKIGNSGIGNFREFTGPVTTTSTSKSVVKASSHPRGPALKSSARR